MTRFMILLVYLTLIPGFGLIYTYLLPHDFYGPYAKYEPSAVADADRLGDYIKQAAINSYDEDKRPNDPWFIDTSKLKVRSLSSDDPSRLAFEISVSGVRKSNQQILDTLSLHLWVHRDPEISVSEDKSGNYTCRLIHSGDPDEFSSSKIYDFMASHLFRCEVSQPSPIAMLSFEPKSERAFNRLMTGVNGDPSAFSNRLLRMVYFSATTITTLGYGDIVPMTDTARLLTAIEAVSGWILAGLFLNAITKSRSS